jgi:hypothetical protein
MNPTPKQRSVIYRKAAEKVDKGTTYCCWAIEEIISSDWIDETDFPEMYLFEPHPEYSEPWGWFGDWKELENQNSRIFALLLASEIAKQK